MPVTFILDDFFIQSISKLNQAYTAKVTFGKIATSNTIPNLPLQVTLLHEANFDVIEMEGAALMQACWLFKTSCVVIRGISNNMSETMTSNDIKTSADKAAKVLIDVITSQTSAH